MRLRYDYAAIVALASAAAVLTALSDYALSMEKSLDAVSLRIMAAFVITAIALVAARLLGRASTTVKREALTEGDRKPLLISAPIHHRHASADPLVMKRLGDEISACNPIVFTLCDHVQEVVANTEDVAMAIMTQLNKVDQTVTELLRYLRVSSHDRILRS